MTIAPTLQRYMADRGIQYDLIPHEPAMTSLGTAHAGHIPSDCMAKGVMLSNGQDYMLAIMPASNHLRLSDLKSELGQELRLASEDEIVNVFRDCDRGAIPPWVAFQQGSDHVRGQVVRSHSGECAIEPAERRPHGAVEEGRAHAAPH